MAVDLFRFIDFTWLQWIVSLRITVEGQVKQGKRWETTPFDIAKELPKKAYLIARVNGDLWDMSRPLEGDCELKIFAFEDDEGRDTFWHSSAHILGQV